MQFAYQITFFQQHHRLSEAFSKLVKCNGAPHANSAKLHVVMYSIILRKFAIRAQIPFGAVAKGYVMCYPLKCIDKSKKRTFFKGSLTRDFRLQVFFMNKCPPGPQVFHWGRFEFFSKIRGDIRE